MGIRITQGRTQGGRDARDVARFALASDVANRLRIDAAIAIAVVIGGHVVGEAVGADEALLARVLAHPVVHPGHRHQELVAQVDLSAGRGIIAGALHVVGVVARVIQVADDLQLHARIGVGVDEVHRGRHVRLAVLHGRFQHVVVAGAGLVLEGGACLQAIVAAHLEGHHAGRARLHVGLLGDDLVLIDIRGDRARLRAADAFHIRAPGGREVFGFHRRRRVAGRVADRAVVAGVDRIAIGDDTVLGGAVRAVHGPRDVLAQGTGHRRQGDGQGEQCRGEQAKRIAEADGHGGSCACDVGCRSPGSSPMTRIVVGFPLERWHRGHSPSATTMQRTLAYPEASRGPVKFRIATKPLVFQCFLLRCDKCSPIHQPTSQKPRAASSRPFASSLHGHHFAGLACAAPAFLTYLSSQSFDSASIVMIDSRAR